MKGVLVHLAAVALSVKPGGSLGSAHVGGDISSSGDNVTTIELEGPVTSLTVDGKVIATGANATGVRMTDAQIDTSTLAIETPNGTPVASR